MSYFLLFVAVLGVFEFIGVWAICEALDIPMPWKVWRKLDELEEIAKTPRTRAEVIPCRACGRQYHKSWGSICPDCSGAD